MPTFTTGGAPGDAKLALAVTWEAKEGEEATIADILRRMADAVAKSEPGTLIFWPHRSPTDPRVFFLYELYQDEAAFATHQQTEHFKRLILGDAVPRLARRERVQLNPMRG